MMSLVYAGISLVRILVQVYKASAYQDEVPIPPHQQLQDRLRALSSSLRLLLLFLAFTSFFFFNFPARYHVLHRRRRHHPTPSLCQRAYDGQALRNPVSLLNRLLTSTRSDIGQYSHEILTDPNPRTICSNLIPVMKEDFKKGRLETAYWHAFFDKEIDSILAARGGDPTVHRLIIPVFSPAPAPPAPTPVPVLPPSITVNIPATPLMSPSPLPPVSDANCGCRWCGPDVAIPSSPAPTPVSPASKHIPLTALGPQPRHRRHSSVPKSSESL
jgi:hypothetical protein